MAHLGEGERPRGALEPVRQTHLAPAEPHGVATEPHGRNPFAELLGGETPPYSYEVFNRVWNKLADMRDNYPEQNWFYTELHEDEKADVRMVFHGFWTVAYDRLGGPRKAILQDRFYEAATGDVEGDFSLFSPEDFTENQRIYPDRFELTFRQAKAVQKIMRYLEEDYDPGGSENTPENMAKRTFYYDDYIGRPIPKDHPDQTLTAKPARHQEIAAYLRTKQK